jgi:hypothetical protein
MRFKYATFLVHGSFQKDSLHFSKNTIFAPFFYFLEKI